MRQPTNNISYKYLLSAILSGFISSVLVLIIFTSSLPFNPVQHKMNYVEQVFTYTPQGWAFFTRDAREPQIYIYKISKNNELIKVDQNHSNINNLFGLSRGISKLGMEAETISSIINKKRFLKTEWNYKENLIGKIPKNFVTVKNPILSPIMCGDYLIVYQSLVPWAWSKAKKKVKVKSQVMKIRVIC